MGKEAGEGRKPCKDEISSQVLEKIAFTQPHGRKRWGGPWRQWKPLSHQEQGTLSIDCLTPAFLQVRAGSGGTGFPSTPCSPCTKPKPSQSPQGQPFQKESTRKTVCGTMGLIAADLARYCQQMLFVLKSIPKTSPANSF